jgi:hypothetical protein
MEKIIGRVREKELFFGQQPIDEDAFLSALHPKEIIQIIGNKSPSLYSTCPLS